MRPPILGIAEVVLNVDDIEKMKSFYQEVIGCTFHSEGCFEEEGADGNTGEPTIAFLAVNSSETPLAHVGHPPLLVLIDYRRHASSKERFKLINISASTLNHVAFEINASEFESQRTWLIGHGLKPIEVEFTAMRAKALFVRDPEGNSLEFICPI